MRAKSALPGWLIGRSPDECRLFEIRADGVRATSADCDRVIPFVSVLGVTIARGFLLSDVTILPTDGRLTVRGIPSRRAQAFCRTLEDRARSEQSMALQSLWPVVLDLYSRIAALPRGQRFIRRSETDQLPEVAESAEPLCALAHSFACRQLAPEADAAIWDEVARLLSDPAGIRAEWNGPFISRELEKWRSFLDAYSRDPQTGEALPLTDEQRRAVLSDEDTTLVVAAAGSGKTTVVSARVAWLLKARADELSGHDNKILVTCFPRVVAKELQTRLGSGLGERVDVKHMHSLAYEVIERVEGGPPRVAAVAKDKLLLYKWVRKAMDRAAGDPSCAEDMVAWASYRDDFKSVFDFPDLTSYNSYLKEVKPLTFKGETVRSLEECEIANFLHLNGVRYEYERDYPDPTRSPDRRPYRPDFYLSDYGIYIEHFAVDKNGRTPRFIPQKKYTDDMRWKRNLHKKRGTALIETYSYQRRDGTLFDLLTQRLLEHRVFLRPGAVEDPLKELRTLGEVDRLQTLMATFLQHVMSNQHDGETLRLRAAKMPDSTRAQSFVRLFERILRMYREYLEERGEIDFYVMVNRAASYVREGCFQSPYRHVIVDEFQDISTSLANLIGALVDQRRPEARLFCVGDDWQAIFRFLGADLSVMRHMNDEAGRLELNKTYRFNSAIAQVSSQFILKNPRQIRKTVEPASVVDRPRVFVILGGSQTTRPLHAALSSMATESPGGCSLFLIGRYTEGVMLDHVPFLRGELQRLKGEYRREFPSIRILREDKGPGPGTSVRTVHNVKGLQADYVVVLGLSRGKYGFPSGIQDDPILEIAMARGDPFPHADERRLFYVALTRAKKAVFLVADVEHPSPFVTELEAEDARRDTHLLGRVGGRRCPKCGRGVTVSRTGPYGEFEGCSNFPMCKGAGSKIR